MNAKDTAQRWASSVNQVTIGATSAKGGTRKSEVTLGGAAALPYLGFEGNVGARPAIAVEVWDAGAQNWPAELRRAYGDVVNDPVAWARKGEELGADLICLKLMGCHPDVADRGPDDSAGLVRQILAAISVPLIVWGCGVDDKDNVVLPRCTQAARGENCLFGSVTDKNYRTLVAACIADGHKLLVESPCDINIAKQVNILVHDAGFPLENVVIYPTTAALGYGFEYVYSIMERGRLAGLGGDPLLRQPVLCDVGQEAWRAKEAQAPEEALPGFGEADERGRTWELLTATNSLQAGAELLVLRHPQVVAHVQKTLEKLCGPQAA